MIVSKICEKISYIKKRKEKIMFTNLFTDGNTGSIKASCTCGCDCGCDPEDVEKKGRVGGAKRNCRSFC